MTGWLTGRYTSMVIVGDIAFDLSISSFMIPEHRVVRQNDGYVTRLTVSVKSMLIPGYGTCTSICIDSRSDSRGGGRGDGRGEDTAGGVADVMTGGGVWLGGCGWVERG